MSPIRLSTLGRLELEIGERRITDLAARPRRSAVLVYVACERTTTRDKVLGAFWPERSPSKGRHALNQTLHVLRRDLGKEWLESHGDQLRVTDLLTTDVAAFERAVEAGQWGKALEIYGGRFLDGLYLADTNAFETWVSATQRRLEDRHYDVFRRLLAERREADPAGALETARSWVRAYPHMEEAQYAYVKRLLAAGRRAEALRQWEHYGERLTREGLAEPSAAWRRLGERLRGEREPVGQQARASEADAGEESGEETGEEAREGGTTPWPGSPLRGPRLVRMIDGREAESYRLRPGETVVGREEGQLSFPEDSLMSARHAVFRVEERSRDAGDTTGARYVDYRCTVRDEGSSNGVYVRIRDEWPLEDGDMFAAGEQIFRYRLGKGETR